MSANNVPNKIDKKNIFGNMIIESGYNSIKEEKLVNHENIINNEIPTFEIENHKETNFPNTKFKKHKNQNKQKGEIKTKSSLYLRKDSKDIQKNENKNTINNNLSLKANEQNEDINKISSNIENNDNKENIPISIESSINSVPEMKEEKPSLTWNTVLDPDSSFIPMEYINDIWDSFIEKEKLNFYSYDNIIKIQTDIKESMRCILIDWLISLQNKFFFNTKTLFLTVNLIDRYLSKKPILRTRFQLLGVTALFISSKYEEMYMKNINDFVEITARAFNKEQILEMESELIDLVDFNLELPLSIDFFGILGSIYKFDKNEFRFGYFLLEAYLLDCCKYKHSQISLSVCYIILGLRKMKNICPNQNNNFIKYYSNFFKINFDIWKEYDLIIECGKNIYNFYEKKDQVVYKEVYYIFNDLFI